MNNTREIEQFLVKIHSKAVVGKLSTMEAARLKDLAENTCHLEANLLLVRAAWGDDRGEIFGDWESCLQEVLSREKECWSSEDMAKILRLAVELYSYAEKDALAWNAASDLFRRRPDDWQTILICLSVGFPFLTEEQLSNLIRRLVELAPLSNLTSYQQGFYSFRLWEKFQKEDYREWAVKLYRQALDLDLQGNHPQLAAVARKNLLELGGM